MAGVINEWRTNRQEVDDAFEWPTTNPNAAETDLPLADDGMSKQYAGAVGSRASAFPSMDVWYMIFDSAAVSDYSWDPEDWKFLSTEILKLSNNNNISKKEKINYILKYALDDSNDIGGNFQSELKEKKKLPPHMNDLFKRIYNDYEVKNLLNETNKEALDLIAFQLLITGKIDEVLEGSVITEGNGFAGFVTNLNKKVDEYLKVGVQCEVFPTWDPDTGLFTKMTTNSFTEDVGWFEASVNFVSDAAAGTAALFDFYSQEFLEKSKELNKIISDNLKPDFRELQQPLRVGNRARSSVDDVLTNSVKQQVPLDAFSKITYNDKNINITKQLVKGNIADEQILQKLIDTIGRAGDGSNRRVSIANGINDTNLYQWAQQKEDKGFFTPDFSNSPLFKGNPVQSTNFILNFNYATDLTKIKSLILSTYQTAWYAYVFWFIRHKEKIRNNEPVDEEFNQVQVKNYIAKQVATSIAKIFAIIYNQYVSGALYLECLALINSDDQQIDLEELENAINNAKKASENSITNSLTGGGLEQADELSEEQIAERQKFIKQCILMYNFEGLKDNYRAYIKNKIGDDPMHSSGPFNYRFHALNNGSPDDGVNSLVTRLQMPPQTLMEPFLEITPDVQAFLVPKIRLFRINSSNTGMKEIEFVFDKVEDKKRIDQLLSAQFDRGNSYGIKSFDFSFEGSNPATSRNDITANLSLYFQSFQELITTRNHGEGDYRIIDLLVFPVNPKNRQGTKTIRAEEYDPSYYRIRADVGWMVPENSPQLTQVLTNRGFTYDGLRNAILSTNKSFYLNAVDHEMDLKDDGSVEMKINYRAYAENALKTSKYDVMSTATLRKNRQKFKEAMAVAIQDNNCNEEELATLKDLFQIAEQEMIKSTYRSLLKRLNEKQKIFFVDVNVEDIKKFRKEGYFSSKSPPRLLGVNGSGAVVQQGSVEDRTTEAEAAKAEGNEAPATMGLLKDGVKDYSAENLREDNRINFFYLGDLIYTAMDSLYEQDGSLRKDIEKTAFLLGSFDTADTFGSQNVKQFNIMDIPVSVQYFYEWFTQNVIKTKKLSYPIMDFIRDLTNDLVIKLLFDNCGRKPIDTKMRFNTATFLAVGKGENNNVDTFIEFSNSKGDPNYPVIDVAKHYGYGLPFLTDKQGTANINNFFNYVLIYPVKTSAIYGGVGNFFVDGARGVHHFNLGKNKGLIKKIKFSKTDMNYIREARFFRNGFDGLQQLSAVYKASIEMFGNTMYYPGMELYIDAIGIGGPDFRSNVKGSLAHILGFGGYHLVTRVNMNIAPGKFSTTVEAQWFHSGVAGDRSLGPERPKNEETKEPESNIENKPPASQSGIDEFTTKCSPIVTSLESYVESVKNDPLAENEFNPDLSQFSPQSGENASNDTSTVITTTEYSSEQGENQTTSNIDEVPDIGEN